MSKFYQIAEKRGDIFIHNVENWKHLVSMLYEGKYLMTLQRLEPKSDIKSYRRCYFAKLDALAAEVGEERYSMHEIIKDNVLSDMIKQTPEAFTLEVTSTKYLTTTGWVILLERLDLWAFLEYGTILK